MTDTVPLRPLGAPTVELLTNHILEQGDCGDVRLTALSPGYESLTYLCENGPAKYPNPFVVQCPQDRLSAAGLQDQYYRLQLLQGACAPRPLHLGRLGANPVLFVEYIRGEHKDFNQLTDPEIAAFAGAVSLVHSVTDARFSHNSGQMPCAKGTYADYIRAMVDESVCARLYRTDLSRYVGAEALLVAGKNRLDRTLDMGAALFAGRVFTRLHHDINPNNVLFGPSNEVVFVDWNYTVGDPADDLDYIFTNNNGSPEFKRKFLDLYTPHPETGDVLARMDAYTLKNRMDDFAWTIERCEQLPGDPQRRADYQERYNLLDATLAGAA